jgi:hypothetical protein
MATGKKKSGASEKSKTKSIGGSVGPAGGQPRGMSERRGVATFNTNEIVLLVRGTVEQVAGAFVELKKGKVWQKQVQDKPITVYYPSYIILQMVGHPWVTIVNFGRAGADAHPKPEDAQALSRRLKTRAIYFGNSDTASATRFDVYEKGRRLEKVEADSSVRFESTLHDPAEAPEDGPDIYTFVDRLMRDQDAYVSGTLNWRSPSTVASGANYQPELKTDFDEPIPVVRVDYVALSKSQKNPMDDLLRQWKRIYPPAKGSKARQKRGRR